MSKRDEDRKKQEDWLMAQITAIMEKSLKAAMQQAMDDIFKDFH